MEEVRRELIKHSGKARGGPNSLYAGGLWVRSSMDAKLQDAAAQALREGLARFDGGRGWRDTASASTWRRIGRRSSTALPSAPAFPTG